MGGQKGGIFTPLRFFLDTFVTSGDFSTKFLLFLVYKIRRLFGHMKKFWIHPYILGGENPKVKFWPEN